MDQTNQGKGGIFIVILVIVIVVAGYLLLTSTQAPERTVSETPASVLDTPSFNRAQLLGEAPLEAEQQAAIAKHKAAIIARVAEGPLTSQESAIVGNIMLTQAHLYNFTSEEREAIFTALR